MSRKRGLGRGLDALIRSEEGVTRLPLGRLKPNRFQPRASFDEEGIAELAESIRTQGMVQPLVVTPAEGGDYTIIAGERRWRAARRAGLEEVPVVVREVASDREMLELALVENLQRADLNPLEEAEAYRSLQSDFGLTQEEIARRVGKSQAAISNAIRLLQLPAEIQNLLREGTLTAGQARPLLALEDPDQQLGAARRAAREGLTARELEALARAPGKRRRAAPPLEPHAAAAAERLTRLLQTRVEIARRGKGGEIRIRFHSEEELMRLYDRISGRAAGKG